MKDGENPSLVLLEHLELADQTSPRFVAPKSTAEAANQPH
jgi:hypothetical protein